jgi:hypothetical protein
MMGGQIFKHGYFRKYYANYSTYVVVWPIDRGYFFAERIFPTIEIW